MCAGMSISGTTVTWFAHGVGDDRADISLRQVLRRHDLGVRVALDPEPLIVGEVEVQVVELDRRHLADARP